MARFIFGVLFVLHHTLVNCVKFYPTEFGDSGIGYGEKYTNIEYGPEVYGIASDYGYKGGIINGVPYEEGVVGIPKAAGYAYGSGFVEPGYKEFNYRPLGAAHNVEFVSKPISYGYDSGLYQYPNVGINKGIAPIAPILPPIHSVGYHHGINPGLGYSPIVAPGLLGHEKLIGGTAVDQNNYHGGNKNIAGEHYVKSHGVNGEELKHGDAGFSRGNVAVKDIKGDSVHFIDANGGKAAHHSGKEFHGGEHFDKEGKHGGEQVVKEGFKKGHNIKSFKKSHHLDETGKTEEYYDEKHDEGGNYAFDGHSGLFGENGASSFKGGQEDGKYTSGEAKKEGHFDKEYLVDKVEAGHGKFGGNKYSQNQEVFGNEKGIGEHDLSGHRESSSFFKKYPNYY